MSRRVSSKQAISTVGGWPEQLTRWLDDAIRVPGTNIRFGLDSIIGLLLPGVGDTVTGVGSLTLLFVALRRGVPSVAMARMVFNIGIDALVGSVPVLGDLFDVAWKANRKNLELIESYKEDPDRKPSLADYALVVGAFLIVALSIALPFVIAALVTTRVLDALE